MRGAFIRVGHVRGWHLQNNNKQSSLDRVLQLAYKVLRCPENGEEKEEGDKALVLVRTTVTITTKHDYSIALWCVFIGITHTQVL